MKKSILNLKGAQELTKNQLKSVVGGLRTCKQNGMYVPCPTGQCCATTTDWICYTIGSPNCGVEFPG
jgi:bacteriocin-like protein